MSVIGPQGLENIAKKIHNATLLLAKGLRESGNVVENEHFFDTIKVSPRLSATEIRLRAHEVNINLRYFPDGCIGKTGRLSLDRFHFTFLYLQESHWTRP